MDNGSAFLMVIFFIFIVIVLGSELLRRTLWGMIYKRLGERMWKAWVPVVELWTLYRLGGLPGALSIAAWGVVIGSVVLSFRSFFVPDELPWLFWLLWAGLVIPVVVLSLLAVYRINKQLGLHPAFFLIYIFASEIIWLIVAIIISKSTQQMGEVMPQYVSPNSVASSPTSPRDKLLH